MWTDLRHCPSLRCAGAFYMLFVLVCLVCSWLKLAFTSASASASLIYFYTHICMCIALIARIFNFMSIIELDYIARYHCKHHLRRMRLSHNLIIYALALSCTTLFFKLWWALYLPYTNIDTHFRETIFLHSPNLLSTLKYCLLFHVHFGFTTRKKPQFHALQMYSWYGVVVFFSIEIIFTQNYHNAKLVLVSPSIVKSKVMFFLAKATGEQAMFLSVCYTCS